jgi:hypothetical protein
MALKAQRIDTWAAAIEDKPGSLAAKLDALSSAGVNLQFVIARRAPDKPGKGVVFVTPIQGAARCRAARQAGFKQTDRLHAVQSKTVLRAQTPPRGEAKSHGVEKPPLFM